MQRSAFRSLAATGLALVAACGDEPSTGPGNPTGPSARVALGAEVPAAARARIARVYSLIDSATLGASGANLLVPDTGRALVLATTADGRALYAALTRPGEPASLDARNTAVAAVQALLVPNAVPGARAVSTDLLIVQHPIFGALAAAVDSLASAGQPFADADTVAVLAAFVVDDVKRGLTSVPDRSSTSPVAADVPGTDQLVIRNGSLVGFAYTVADSTGQVVSEGVVPPRPNPIWTPPANSVVPTADTVVAAVRHGVVTVGFESTAETRAAALRDDIAEFFGGVLTAAGAPVSAEDVAPSGRLTTLADTYFGPGFPAAATAGGFSHFAFYDSLYAAASEGRDTLATALVRVAAQRLPRVTAAVIRTVEALHVRVTHQSGFYNFGYYGVRPTTAVLYDRLIFTELIFQPYRVCKREGSVAEVEACINRLRLALASPSAPPSLYPDSLRYAPGRTVVLPPQIGRLSATAAGALYGDVTPSVSLRNAAITWSSSDPAVVDVDSTGPGSTPDTRVLRAGAAGEAMVVATYAEMADTLLVRVAPIDVTGTFDLVVINGNAPSAPGACFGVLGSPRSCPITAATYELRADGTIAWTTDGAYTGTTLGRYVVSGHDNYAYPIAVTITFDEPAALGLTRDVLYVRRDGQGAFAAEFAGVEAPRDLYQYSRRAAAP
jgi:hypothetical protein